MAVTSHQLTFWLWDLQNQKFQLNNLSMHILVYTMVKMCPIPSPSKIAYTFRHVLAISAREVFDCVHKRKLSAKVVQGIPNRLQVTTKFIGAGKLAYLSNQNKSKKGFPVPLSSFPSVLLHSWQSHTPLHPFIFTPTFLHPLPFQKCCYLPPQNRRFFWARNINKGRIPSVTLTDSWTYSSLGYTVKQKWKHYWRNSDNKVKWKI